MRDVNWNKLKKKKKKKKRKEMSICDTNEHFQSEWLYEVLQTLNLND